MTWFGGRAARRVRRLARPVSRSSARAARPGEALALVAARLRAGAEPEQAWDDIRLDGDGAAGATVTAARALALELGAPLAELLDEVGSGVADDESAAAERRAALAGPAATGRVLGWLPVAGVLLALALGADVVAVAADGGVGTASVVGGAVLVVVGRVWTRALVRRAEQEAG